MSDDADAAPAAEAEKAPVPEAKKANLDGAATPMERVIAKGGAVRMKKLRNTKYGNRLAELRAKHAKKE